MRPQPILFSTPMVQAILAGRKTQTRRMARAYWDVGDLLWVRETWRVAGRHDNHAPRMIMPRSCTVLFEAGGSAANGPGAGWTHDPAWPPAGTYPEWAGKGRPSMFMPRWASRITLHVESVRTEPLQDITESDALAEGVFQVAPPDPRDGMRYFAHEPGRPGAPTAARAFRTLWTSLNGWESWAANPVVHVTTFRAEINPVDVVAERMAA